MANRYANLVGSNKIKDEYQKINQGFDAVEADMDQKADAGDLTNLQNTVNDHIGAGGAAHAEATTSSAGFMAAADKQKLDGIEEGAQVNQNAFAKVNDVEADDPSDTFTITGGTGITVTSNPLSKEVTITATGESTPGPHGTSHTEHGADPIPNATTTEGGLMSAEHVQMLESHSSRHEIGGDDEIDLEDLQGSPAALKSHLAETVANGVHGMGSIASQDYETGIWTPDLRFGGNADGLTYSVRSGVYTRLGRLVDIKCTIILTNKGTSVGAAEIYGLPFNNFAFGPIAFTALYSLITFPADGKELVPVVSGSQSKLELRVTGDNVTRVDLTDTNFANNSQIQISGTYYI